LVLHIKQPRHVGGAIKISGRVMISRDGAQHLRRFVGLDPLPQLAAVAKGSTNAEKG
jgi:hypothetical protein